MTLKDTTELDALKVQIENLPKNKQLHILHILSVNNVVINFNSSGSLVNLSFVGDDVLTQIIDYINTADKAGEN